MTDREERKENSAELTNEELEGVEGGIALNLQMTDYVCLECNTSRKAYMAPTCSCGRRMVKGKPED